MIKQVKFECAIIFVMFFGVELLKSQKLINRRKSMLIKFHERMMQLSLNRETFKNYLFILKRLKYLSGTERDS